MEAHDALARILYERQRRDRIAAAAAPRAASPDFAQIVMSSAASPVVFGADHLFDERKKDCQFGWYRVCLNTIVRKMKDLNSERLRIIPRGSQVHVVEIQGRRCRIDQPLDGWVSRVSSRGELICSKIGPPTDCDHYSVDCAGKVVIDIVPVVCGQNDWPEGEEIFKIIIGFLIDPEKTTWNPEVKKCGGSVQEFWKNTTVEDFEGDLLAWGTRRKRVENLLGKATMRNLELSDRLAYLQVMLKNLQDSKTHLIQQTSAQMGKLASDINELRRVESMKKESMPKPARASLYFPEQIVVSPW